MMEGSVANGLSKKHPLRMTLDMRFFKRAEELLMRKS